MDITEIASSDEIGMIRNLAGFQPFIVFLDLIDKHHANEAKKLMANPI